MYKVATDLTGDWKIKSVLQNIGVKESPDISDYIMVLHKVKAQCQCQSVPEPTLNAIVHSVVPKIAQSPNLFENTMGIFVPDEHGIMRKTTEVCFNDADWIKKPEKLILAHPEITSGHCEILGVKPYRKQYLLNSGVGIAYGQSENLTKRIKNLLRAYKKEDVLKELLQNADDSYATEVEFMLDCRKHNTETVLSDEWKKLQGPALIVTNNGHFSENDLKAIQKLGEGSKSKDCSKTGRYGVGFNSVYNITDCPSMHVCIENASYLCIFDPNLRYNIGGTIEKPGQRIELGKIKKGFKDVYDAHFNNGDDMLKTLFRLPLRTEEMAKMSEISHEETTAEQIKNIFREMYKYVRETLLFLVNIKKVRFVILKVEDGELLKTCEEFSIFPYNFTTSDLERKTKVTDEYIKNPSPKEVAIVSSKACIHHVSNGNDCCQKHYHLVERIGFSEKEVYEGVIVDEFREFYLFPKGAVAKAIDDVKCQHCTCIQDNHVKCKLKCSSEISNIFCTLPLSTRSNLPVLVNGNFLLEHEARRGLYIGTSGSEREWNRNLLLYCVLPCYILLLKQLKENIKFVQTNKITKDDIKKSKAKIYAFFPKCIADKEKDYWQYFSFLFYQEIFTRNEDIIPVAYGDEYLDFVRPYDQFIVCDDTHSITKNNEKSLLQILQNMGFHIDTLPKIIEENFKETGNALTHISPQVIRKRMKMINRKIISQICFKDKSYTSRVLEYCIEDFKEGLKTLKKSKEEELEKVAFFEKVEEEFIGLPLLLLADDTLTIFSKDEPVFLSRFSEIFLSKKFSFVQKQLVSTLENYEFPQILKKFKFQDFLEFLPHEIKEGTFRGYFPIKFKDQHEIKKAWLKTVWKFLYEACKDLPKDDQLKYSHLKNDYLKDWLLLFARLNSTEYLLPVSFRNSILYFGQVQKKDEAVVKVLKALPVYMVHDSDFFQSHRLHSAKANEKEIYPQDFKKDFFGSINSIQDLVNVLSLSHSHCRWELRETEAKIILNHLEWLLYDENQRINKLHTLPVFMKYDGSLFKINRHAVILEKSDIPLDGFHTIEDKYQIIFIQDGYPRLYAKLRFTRCTAIKFYMCYVFPILHWLSQSAISKHMDYVKQILLNVNLFHNEEGKIFMNSLSKLKCILTCEGVFKAPHELYDPNNELFDLVFTQEHFPQSKYREDSWLNILKSCGLISEISKELAIKIATLIQDLEDETAEKASAIFFHEIKRREFTEDETFLNKLKFIKFLIPKKLETIKEEIYRSLNKSTSRVCFNGSVHCSQENLVWTSKVILPVYACCFREETYMKLGVKLIGNKSQNQDELKISFSDVLKPIDNLTSNTDYHQETLSCRSLPRQYQDEYKKVLEDVYKFLQQSQPLDSSQIELLRERSIILVNGSASMDIPIRSNLSEQMLLPPYINQVDAYWRKYFDLFEEIGCQKISNVEQIFDVLQEIKLIVKEKHLRPNELAIVHRAVSYISSVLKNNPISDSTKIEIFLPCIKSFHPKPQEPVFLMPSFELIYIDDYRMQKRLKNFEGNFLLLRYEGVDDSEDLNKSFVSGLPAKHMPKVLSKLVHEILAEPISEVEVPSEHFSKNLSIVFSSSGFLQGLERLISFEYKATNKKPPDLEKLFEVLRSTKVSVLQKVQTILMYDEKVIPDSEIDKEVYTTVTADSFQIYLHVNQLTQAVTKIAQSVLTLLEFHSIKFFVNKNALILPSMIYVSPCEIPELLDTFDIPRSPIESEWSYLPTPGGVVPQVLYPYLRNNFEKFLIGDFLAIRKEFEGEELYIYGIVRGFENIESVPISQLVYNIQVGEDPNNIIKLKGFELHGFDRMSSVVQAKEISKLDKQEAEDQIMPKNYEAKIEKVMDVLSSLSGLDEESKEKVIRNLYLNWHPDKHTKNNQAFANRVFQFLCNEIIANHTGFEKKFDAWNSSVRTHGYSKRSDQGDSDHKSILSANNPQPVESRRWYRQAEKDLQAAKGRKELTCDSFFNWHCFMAKQVQVKR